MHTLGTQQNRRFLVRTERATWLRFTVSTNGHVTCWDRDMGQGHVVRLLAKGGTLTHIAVRLTREEVVLRGLWETALSDVA